MPEINMNEQKAATLILGFVVAVCFQTFMVDSHQQCQNRAGHQTWDHSIINLTYAAQHFPDPQSFGHNEIDDCPSYRQLITYDHLSAQNLSLCPWTTEMSHDLNRFPHNMTYARCSCKHCVTWDESGNRHECKAHYHSFKVIRRQCDMFGNYNYFYTHEHLPIACVCSHENIRVVGSTG